MRMRSGDAGFERVRPSIVESLASDSTRVEILTTRFLLAVFATIDLVDPRAVTVMISSECDFDLL